jgi:hypothetical protein
LSFQEWDARLHRWDIGAGLSFQDDPGKRILSGLIQARIDSGKRILSGLIQARIDSGKNKPGYPVKKSGLLMQP